MIRLHTTSSNFNTFSVGWCVHQGPAKRICPPGIKHGPPYQSPQASSKMEFQLDLLHTVLYLYRYCQFSQTSRYSLPNTVVILSLFHSLGILIQGTRALDPGPLVPGPPLSEGVALSVGIWHPSVTQCEFTQKCCLIWTTAPAPPGRPSFLTAACLTSNGCLQKSWQKSIEKQGKRLS